LAEDTDDRAGEMEGIAMNESITQADCKLITEKLLGEEWNEMAGKYYKMSNRTFTDPQDFFACFEKLVELGEWEKFKWFFIEKFKEQLLDIRTSMLCPYQWLNSRTESGHYRLCVLCAEWLKAQGTVVEWRQATDKTTWS
jgi:hypothetical protein